MWWFLCPSTPLTYTAYSSGFQPFNSFDLIKYIIKEPRYLVE